MDGIQAQRIHTGGKEEVKPSFTDNTSTGDTNPSPAKGGTTVEFDDTRSQTPGRNGKQQSSTRE